MRDKTFDEIQLKKRLLEAGIAKPNEIIGCSEPEIEEIERKLKLKLPLEYKKLLKSFGKSAGRFMDDVTMYYEDILDLKDTAKKILDNWEDGKLLLPDKAFVFGVRYGEQFNFFLADGVNDDPEVFFYFEGDGEFRVISESIWGIFLSELEEIEDYFSN